MSAPDTLMPLVSAPWFVPMATLFFAHPQEGIALRPALQALQSWAGSRNKLTIEKEVGDQKS